ncbi:galactose ABC transporter substrate-binding protein [Clostridium cellulovorans]|uniref:D-galactose/methyl-galactoside binding periplasmic protein MglB n=1 Tax=Clostridium cellulovorans (strain ATCC 35296 / DSM 3052 / OCM 3 / 743B) TaxID=573061 RepID=D9SUT1_CLOC7|nr:galactose ABC transporter substrate-binding protein [Clostridium cellulovorans]ADL50986.1 D-galactose-binding periplasmic protein precursor [Clostridium cellulovorans 743B]
MKIFRKIIANSIVMVLITISLSSCNKNSITTNLNIKASNPINVGVLLYSFDDIFTALIKENLEKIQNQNPDKIKFTFFDGKANLSIQQELIQKIIDMNFDLIITTFDDKKEGILENIINKIKQKNTPIIFFNATIDPNVIKAYKKAIIINTNVEQSGIQQGNIIIDAWNTNRKSIDRNKDNILQYILLQGSPDSYAAIVRSKSVIKTINDAGIKTEQLSSIVCNWEKDCAKTSISSLFLRYGNKLDIIIANNDAMAIGAIETLQKFGYNLENNNKNIAVIGIDAIPPAQDLIKKGVMLGSVIQDPHVMAETLFKVGMNLVDGRNPTEGTDYKFDETGVKLILPYQEFTKKTLPSDNNPLP